MFWQVRDALSHCIRIDPTHGDFGGFFCALFEKVAPGPASLPPKVAGTSVGIPRPEPRLKEAKMSKVKEKSLNPIPSLLATPNSTHLQWLVDWFGLQSDVEEAWNPSCCLLDNMSLTRQLRGLQTWSATLPA